MTTAPVAACTGYHAIGARTICGVAVTAPTDSYRAGFNYCNCHVWSRHGQEYPSWSWDGCSAVLGDMQ